MKRYSTIALFFWIGLGICILVGSCRLGLGTLRSPGAGLLPFLLGALLVAFSLVSLCRILFHQSRVQDLVRKEKKRLDLGRVGLVLAVLLGYAFSLERLGYVLTSFLMLTFLFKAMGSTRWSVAITTSVVTVLGTYFVFTYLGLVFPSGIIQWEGLLK